MCIFLESIPKGVCNQKMIEGPEEMFKAHFVFHLFKRSSHVPYLFGLFISNGTEEGP